MRRVHPALRGSWEANIHTLPKGSRNAPKPCITSLFGLESKLHRCSLCARRTEQSRGGDVSSQLRDSKHRRHCQKRCASEKSPREEKRFFSSSCNATCGKWPPGLCETKIRKLQKRSSEPWVTSPRPGGVFTSEPAAMGTQTEFHTGFFFKLVE